MCAGVVVLLELIQCSRVDRADLGAHLVHGRIGSEPGDDLGHPVRAIILHPKFGLALNELGVLYLKRGDLDRAEEAFVKVIQLSPDAPEPILNYGICLLQQKKFAQAETQLREALKKNEHAFTAHMYLGITLISFRRYTEAEDALRKSIALGGPKASKAHYYLGGVYWETGRLKEAADELEVYLQLEPKAANAERVRATIKSLRGT